MKRLILTILLVFIAGSAWGATYYMTKADSGTFYVNTTQWPEYNTDGTGHTTCSANTVTGCLTTAGANNTLVLSGGASGKTYTGAEDLGATGARLQQNGQTLRAPDSTLDSGVANYSSHSGAVTLTPNGGNLYAVHCNAKTGYLVSGFVITAATGTNYSGIYASGGGTIQKNTFSNNYINIEAGVTAGSTTIITRNLFVGPVTSASNQGIWLVTGTGTVNIVYNIFKPSNISGGDTSYGYAAPIRIQGTGTYNIYNNAMMGVSSACVTITGTPASGTVNVKNNMLVCGSQAGDVAVNLAAGQTTDVSYNWIAIPAFTPAVPVLNADTETGNIYSISPKYAKSSRNGWVAFSKDDWDADAWTYLYGSDGTDGVVAQFKNRGMKLTVYVDAARIIADENRVSRLQWLMANNVEIGSHGYHHYDLAVTGDLYTVTANNVTVDRTADTIACSAGGSVSGFKAKSLATIKTELDALGCTLTPTAKIGTGVGTVNTDLKGEALANGAAVTALTILVGDESQGLLKAEMADAIPIIEGITAGLTIKSFATPYGTTSAAIKAAVKAYGAGQITSMRQANIDATSSHHISNLDRYNVACFICTDITANTTSGDATNDIRANINGLMAWLAETGSYAIMHAHSTTEITAAQWGTILDEVLNWSDNVESTKSVGEAITDIMVVAEDDGDGTLTYAWNDQSDYRLLPGSPAINAGVVVSGVHPGTDYAGNPNYRGAAPDIGAYEKSLGGLTQQFNIFNRFAPHRRLH